MRLGVFMVQAVVCIGVAIVFIITNRNSVASDITIALQSPFAAVIFGMRSSLLCCSARRKEDKLAKNVDQHIPHSSKHFIESHQSDATSNILVIGFEEERRSMRGSG